MQRLILAEKGVATNQCCAVFPWTEFCNSIPPRADVPGGVAEGSFLDPKEKSAVSKEAEHWSLTTLREKMVKIGARVVSHGRYVTFQLAEVAISRALFAEILRLIDRLRPAPLPP